MTVLFYIVATWIGWKLADNHEPGTAWWWINIAFSAGNFAAVATMFTS
jgi:hypothetical protein